MVDGSLHSGVAALEDEDEDEDEDAWAQEQLRELRELAAIGVSIARVLPAQTTAPSWSSCSFVPSW